MTIDWRYHKHDCHDPSNPPVLAATHKLIDAILFPVDEDRPRLVKVEVEVCDDGCGVKYHQRLLNPWFAGAFQQNLTVMPQKGPKLIITTREAFCIDGSEWNKSVHKLAGPGAYPWAGSIMAFQAEERDAMDDRYLDATMEDLDQLKSYFTAYRKTPTISIF